MANGAVLLIAAVCVGVCGRMGFHLGSRGVLISGTFLLVAWGSGWWAATTAAGAGWFQPFGLITPVLLGLLLSSLTWLSLESLRRRLRGRTLRGVSSVSRATGGLLGVFGAVLGIAPLLAAWSLSGTATTSASSVPRASHDPGEEGYWLRSLVCTANRGFIRHLPVVGPVGDEVEALVLIVQADPALREKLALEMQWERIVELPTLQAILHDDAILKDIQRIGRGNLTSLHRLQKNPLIIAFFREEKVRKLVAELSPSELVRRLEELR